MLKRLSHRQTVAAMLVCLCAIETPLIADERPSESNTTADAASGQMIPASGQMIVVLGAAGTPQYGEQFAAWAAQWRQVAKESGMHVQVIGESGEEGADDREQLRDALQAKHQEATPLWIVLLGHGTYARNVAKFNLSGPDVSAKELATWLDPIKRPVVVVNCASASGPFINRLSGSNRVVVTATKSGTEQNYSRFGKFFADAITAPDSDLDHDDEVSVQEAFLRASAGVADFYNSEARIATEHALIDDNGDGKGTLATMFRGTRPIAKAKDGAQLDGRAAARVTLAPAGNKLPFTPAELAERNEIEQALEQLRSRKPEMDSQQYDGELEPLLLRLARLYQRAERRLEPTQPEPTQPEPTQPEPTQPEPADGDSSPDTSPDTSPDAESSQPSEQSSATVDQSSEPSDP